MTVEQRKISSPQQRKISSPLLVATRPSDEPSSPSPSDKTNDHDSNNLPTNIILPAGIWIYLTFVVLWLMAPASVSTSWNHHHAKVVPSVTFEAFGSNETRLPGKYLSYEEMMSRSKRFPSVDARVRLYMSSWYTPPCETTKLDESFIQYNYLKDPTDPMAPLLLLQELTVPDTLAEDLATNNDDDDDMSGLFERRKYSHSDINRTFVLDSKILDRGARIFYLNSNQIRQCSEHSCIDTVKFMFPSLHRISMAVSDGYDGIALDELDGNTNNVVPVILQFGDSEVSRAFVPVTHQNESYPVVPIFKKFRWSLSKNTLETITSQPCESPRTVLISETGEHRVQPIISKLTFKRHFGMLDDISSSDIPWSEKINGAVWRGALTGMKRNGFRVVQNIDTQSKTNICLQIQRCKLSYMYGNSTTVNASLVDVMMTPSETKLSGKAVIPETLNGIHLFGPRLSYKDMLQYKAIIMLEGNDVSSGLKWALYSNSVVLAPFPQFTAWAMEELLEPWVHFIPLQDDLVDVEEKVEWVTKNDEKAAKIAHAGSLWISDLLYHPDSLSDEETILDEMLHRYKQHFVHNPLLSYDRLIYNPPNEK